MITRRALLSTGTAALALTGAALALRPFGGAQAAEGTYPFQLSEEEWRARLTEDQFYVLREDGTERAYTSPLNDEKRAGTFSCAGCAQPLFDASTKYDSGTGWPSFFQPLDGGVVEIEDTTLGMTRIAISCANCGGHLGHVFNDGPDPTGLRYCMNGLALSFAAA